MHRRTVKGGKKAADSLGTWDLMTRGEFRGFAHCLPYIPDRALRKLPTWTGTSRARPPQPGDRERMVEEETFSALTSTHPASPQHEENPLLINISSRTKQGVDFPSPLLPTPLKIRQHAAVPHLEVGDMPDQGANHLFPAWQKQVALQFSYQVVWQGQVAEVRFNQVVQIGTNYC